MSSNLDLIKSIGEEAGKKNVDIPDTNGKNNNQLLEILKVLRTPTPPPAPGTEAKAAEEAAKVKPPYYVADNKSITCKKGMLDEGKEVKAEYLGDGQKSLDVLVEKGVVIKS